MYLNDDTTHQVSMTVTFDLYSTTYRTNSNTSQNIVCSEGNNNWLTSHDPFDRTKATGFNNRILNKRKLYRSTTKYTNNKSKDLSDLDQIVLNKYIAL